MDYKEIDLDLTIDTFEDHSVDGIVDFLNHIQSHCIVKFGYDVKPLDFDSEITLSLYGHGINHTDNIVATKLIVTGKTTLRVLEARFLDSVVELIDKGMNKSLLYRQHVIAVLRLNLIDPNKEI